PTGLYTLSLHDALPIWMTPDQVFTEAVNAVRYARKFTDDVEFSPEDAGRSEFDFLCRILEAVIREGAKTVNIPDTVGYTMPEQRSEEHTSELQSRSDLV